MLKWLYTYVATLCVKCFICFRRILQQMLHVASVFISRRGKRAQAEEVHASGGGLHVHAQQHGRATACEQWCRCLAAAGPGAQQHAKYVGKRPDASNRETGKE
jgi:hypothetical protein